MNALQKNLTELLKKHQLSVSKAERLAGLKMSALRNILRGQSKKPSVDILNKLAILFQCSLADLIEESFEIREISNLSSTVKFDLLQDFATFTNDFDKEFGLNLNMPEFIKIQRECYEYSVINNDAKLDQNFLKWLLTKDSFSRIQDK